MRKLLLACAGAGKSTRIVKEALDISNSGGKVLILTYTRSNQAELIREICRANRCHPRNIEVKGWFTFLLEDMIRPYQSCVVPKRISGIFFNESGDPHLIKKGPRAVRILGRKEKEFGKYNPAHFTTDNENRAYTHYIAKLATHIHQESNGKAASRLADIYDAIFIDEVQDLTGWDFDVMCALAKTGIPAFTCVGDFRQTIYDTSSTTKKPQTVDEKLYSFRRMGFTPEPISTSWRCIQSICSLADRVHLGNEHYTLTVSKVHDVPADYAEHVGIFAVRKSRVENYISRYSPTILRLNRNTEINLCEGHKVFNFGKSKGLSFDRVLIVPTPDQIKFLHGDTTAFCKAKTEEPRNKLYVAITRARYSVAFLYGDGPAIDGIKTWGEADQ